MKITLTVNNQQYMRECAPSKLLLDFLREDIGLTGTKEGCGAGECGACTVIMDGKSVNACLVLAAEADGSTILTIEGEAKGGVLTPLQKKFMEHHAVQCGFCTPGMIMSIQSLLERNAKPSEHDIKEAIEGNFCRCTGYQQIIEAVLDVTGQLKQKGELRHV
jgi:carbon-monoxide dehydrogenase small subunit